VSGAASVFARWKQRRGKGRDAADQGTRGEVALTIIQEGQRRDITVRELAVGTKLAGDALLQVLVEKGLVTHEEILERILRISEEHYRAGDPPGESADARLSQR
jgi:hypothetical protein